MPACLNIRKAILLTTVLCSLGLAAAEPERKTRIAFIHFLNGTNSDNYNWLDKSVTSSVDSKMTDIFVYEKPEPEKINSLAERLLPDLSFYNDKEFLKLCFATRVDYVVYGNYQLLYNKDKEKTLLINAGIYSKPDARTISYQSIEVKVDEQMFTKVNTLAADFVTSIKEVIKKQQDGQSEKGEGRLVLKDKQQPAKKGQPAKQGQPAGGTQNNSLLLSLSTGGGSLASVGAGYRLGSIDLGAGFGLSPYPTANGSLDIGGTKADLKPRISLEAAYNLPVSGPFLFLGGLSGGLLAGDEMVSYVSPFAGGAFRSGALDFFAVVHAQYSINHSSITPSVAAGVKFGF